MVLYKTEDAAGLKGQENDKHRLEQRHRLAEAHSPGWGLLVQKWLFFTG